MRKPQQSWRLGVIFLCVGLSLLGCRRRAPETTEVTDGKEFKLGNLLKPFDAPALADLDAQVDAAGGWTERDVLDSLQLLRDRQATEPVLATVEEALSLRNDSDENNEKIKSALGRMAEDGEADFESSFTRHIPQSLKSTNPLMASSTAEQEVSGLTAFGLFTFDWNMRPFASSDTVKSWHTSPDGLCDKVVIRDDLVWSDGTPITAHDVAFSFKVIMSEEIPIPAIRQGTDKIKALIAYDDHTLVYFHEESLASNVWNLNFPVIPKHKYETTLPEDPTMLDSDAHVELENKPVFGGPYTLVSRSQNEIVLEAREDYYMHKGKQVRERPYFQTMRLKVSPDSSTALLGLKTGDIDSMELEASQWTSQTSSDDFYEKNTKAREVEWVCFSFLWNMKTPYFEDVRVREAMSLAFDHEELIQTLRYGRDQPSTGTYHPSSQWHPGPDNAVGYVPQPQVMDREKAKQLLEAAGWKDTDGDGYRDKMVDGKPLKFEFTIMCPNMRERVDICELLKQSLRPIGISCNITPLEWSTYQDKTHKKEFDAAYGGWGAGADPSTSLNIWGTDQDRNYVSYSSEIVDELFVEGRKVDTERKPWKDLKIWSDEEAKALLKLDPELADKQPTRQDCYASIHAILWRDRPYTWLFYRNAYFAFGKKLRGFTFSPRGPFTFSPGVSSVWSPSK